ncbi:MAG: tetratricopeptide repeat protein [Burkholderiales bacterium]|nr:tetratricopeptide repeat protein [Burkholderiales bacterium]
MFKSFLSVTLVSVLAVLSVGCAHQATDQQRVASTQLHAQQEPQEALEERVRRVLGDAPVEPESGLDASLMYQFLIAELAGQRGDIEFASDTYLKLARSTRDVRVAKRATEVALYAKRDAVAFETARIWHEVDPDSEVARRTYAELLIKKGDLRSARPLLAEELADSQRGPQPILMQLYELCATHPDKKEVYQLLRSLTAPYLSLPESHYVLAKGAYGKGDLRQASKHADEALKLRPDWQQGALVKALLMRERDGDEALAYMKRFLQAHPHADELRLNYARVLVADRRYAEAKEEFQALLETNRDNANLVFTLGLLLAQIDDHVAAEQHFRNAIALGYGDPDAAYYQLGQVNERLERPDQAARWYRAVQDGDQFVAAQSRYALLLARRDGVEQGRKHLQSLDVVEDAQRVELIQAEAHMLREVREYEQSYQVLRNALDERPDHPALLYDVALAAEKTDRLDITESRLLKLIELSPENAQAYNALGYTLADRTERFNEARQYIAKALVLEPDDPFILDSMGWVEYRLGNFDEGIRYLRRAYDLQPDPEIAAHLGEVLWMKGVKDEAQRIWTVAAEEYPDNEMLQQVMRKFLGP